MSLAEDVLHVLRIVLEYFGVPPDVLVPVWNSPLCGQYRSIVRMIGSNLPLTPTPRVQFQVALLGHRHHEYIEPIVDTPAIPSFADVMWVFEDEGDSCAKTRNHLPPVRRSTVNQDVMRCPEPAFIRAQRGGPPVRQTPDPEALKKITALESELLKLRAQIALIVTAAPASGLVESPNEPASPGISLSHPLPALTSTPRHVAPPPPPPPPPPPCPSIFTGSKERKDEKDLDKGHQRTKGSENKGMPSMLDVLKDLNHVKLRSVKRSPGGTPVKRRRSKGGTALLNDPAALIAEALKKKFTHLRHNTSSDKENSLELSPFGSPESPKVPHPPRRSRGHRHLLHH
ncbi:mitochondrial fission regulator 2 [Haplochromis burtoni]|uniref:Mitochondrial fission regulator n=1 Tax=Haplochromis burtoni TaxID=8153 RepID=A0A3Q2VKB2_HAPBU|nr:mitochondrial fission regulator 2 [Haplochromis burtoni]